MASVYNYTFDMDSTHTEQAVLCPFPHKTESGIVYDESHASAHINQAKGLFHCKACGVGLNEQQFIEKYFSTDFAGAVALKTAFSTTDTIYDWANLITTQATVNYMTELGIAEEVIQELRIKTQSPETQQIFQVPVTVYDAILDIRSYDTAAEHGKRIKSRQGAPSGLIIPYDIWRKTNPKQVTYICAGEKDMLVARSNGLNAITLTGGEQTTPKLNNEWHERRIVILYDNDAAGKAGGVKLGNFLLQHGAEWVKVVTSFHDICKEKGEDITDFFTKYGKTKEDLIGCIKITPNHIYVAPPKKELASSEPKEVHLIEALEPEYLNKLVQSNVQIVANSTETFTIPSKFTMTKIKQGETQNGEMMHPGEQRTWELTEENAHELLQLCDSNLSEKKIQEHMRKLTHIRNAESYVTIAVEETATVFKGTAIDLFETQLLDSQPVEVTVYSINNYLESGKKYRLTYKIAPHPLKGSLLMAIAINITSANDSITNFSLTEENTKNLKAFQNLAPTVEESINVIVEKAKGLIEYDGYNTLIAAIDLTFHTPLRFHFGRQKDLRGYLDTFIIGESRTGKSSTAEKLRETYELGVFASLAGNSATVAGLIGGSNKVGNGFQTRAGIIPQNNGGLLILEEFGKSDKDIIRELTDIRSSNQVRITRVSGHITLPAHVRMLTISNTKVSKGDVIRPIAQYPDGIKIITDLVQNAEDIARYDLILVMPEMALDDVDPLWEPNEAFTKEQYMTRIRWVWSRKPEQIQFDEGVERYIIDHCNNLNKTYESHIKIFGTEAYKKVSRLAVAIAGYVVSATEDYENILVTKEHVDAAIGFMISIYDNSTFRFKEYVAKEKTYKTVTDGVLEWLTTAYSSLDSASTLDYLMDETKITKQMLEAVSGKAANELNNLLKHMVQLRLIRLNGNEISPTECFRKGMKMVDSSNMRVGQDNESEVEHIQGT